IENRSLTQGKASNAFLWLDPSGLIRKTYTPGIDRQTFDCDPITARYVISKEEFDASIFKDMPLLGSYPKVSDTGTAFFRITSPLLTQDGSVSSRTNQRATRVDQKTWDVQVTSSGLGVDPDQDPVDLSMLASAGLIDWKDPVVERWIESQKATAFDQQPKETEQVPERTRRQAVVARKWIAKGVERLELDRNLQPPAITLRDRKGDCMDQAIALSAVLRSLRIPSRIAIGFRAEPSTVRPTFKFYSWVEYHDSVAWVPIDSFIDSDLVPADRVKISESAMPSINAYEPFLSAIRLMPDVEISARARKP
ncbi:MAG: transglutaminase domain-containing protein, partial [Planctomycetota bacterium]